jgi:hypothetical protein
LKYAKQKGDVAGSERDPLNSTCPASLALAFMVAVTALARLGYLLSCLCAEVYVSSSALWIIAVAELVNVAWVLVSGALGLQCRILSTAALLYLGQSTGFSGITLTWIGRLSDFLDSLLEIGFEAICNLLSLTLMFLSIHGLDVQLILTGESGNLEQSMRSLWEHVRLRNRANVNHLLSAKLTHHLSTLVLSIVALTISNVFLARFST